MIQLNKLLAAINIPFTEGLNEIHRVVFDSRLANENTLFVAIDGVSVDGHSFLQQVADQGCQYAIIQRSVDMPNGLSCFQVPDTRKALAELACFWYEYPLSLIHI